MIMEFECNYDELARVFNDYSQINHQMSEIDSPYFIWKDENKKVAEKLLPVLDDFIMRVPEETRKLLVINPEKIKERCLEILAEK